jgi:DNA-binding GntR family transcriptional regulator
VREALELLTERSILHQSRNRGFFVAGTEAAQPEDDAFGMSAEPAGYYEITEDWLSDAIPSEVTEQFLRERYNLSPVQLAKVLTLGAAEGWVERKGGYGWRLLPVAKTPDSLEQIYRVRLVIEPASLLEPTFSLDHESIRSNRAIQKRMLSGGIETLSPAALINVGAHFHEDIVRMSCNQFLLQTLIRLNRIRRLIEFRSMVDRKRLHAQCREHLEILDMLERGENVDASHFLRRHLSNAIAVKAPLHRGRRSVLEV